MQSHQIEEWALRVINRVRSNQPLEDSRVELKAEWPEPEKAARRIAGHANAAGGTPILWLIGVDEHRGVVGVEAQELSRWYSSVTSQFDGIAPTVTDLNVPAGDRTVVAMYFETDRLPFVVKNPRYGFEGGGPVELEVPWREGTAVRSARRSDLIRLLSPRQQLPEVEVLGAELSAQIYSSDPGPRLEWKLDLEFYLTTVEVGTPVIVPYHAYEVSIEESERPVGDRVLEKTTFQYKAVSSPDNFAGPPHRVTNPILRGFKGFTEELRIQSPSKVNLLALTATESLRLRSLTDVIARVRMQPVNVPLPVLIDVRLTKRQVEQTEATWRMEGSP